jgi:hypothetical protein
MEFVDFNEIIKKQKGRVLRGRSQATIIQKIVTKNGNNPSRVSEFRLSASVLENARLKIGDQVSIAFSPCGSFIRFRADKGNVGGYKIGTSSPNSTNRAGIIKATWYEGMPLIDDSSTTISTRCMSIDEHVKYDVGEVIIKFGPSEVLRSVQDVKQASLI